MDKQFHEGASVAPEPLSRRALFGKGARLGLAIAASLCGAYAVGQAIAQPRSHHPRADFWPHRPSTQRADYWGHGTTQRADGIGPNGPLADSIGPHSPEAFVDPGF